MRIIATILVVLALVIGIVPQFTDCQSQGQAITLQNGKTIPMKCHWTAIAELTVAVPLLAVGILLFVTRRKETTLVLGIIGFIMSIFTILLPNWLIGVCSSEMPCNLIMQPLLTVCGILALAASSAVLFLAARMREPIPQ
ncbi:MAG: DUF4418 family protein [Anaerolineae bacterium]